MKTGWEGIGHVPRRAARWGIHPMAMRMLTGHIQSRLIGKQSNHHQQHTK
jgi:hypothetical protein